MTRTVRFRPDTNTWATCWIWTASTRPVNRGFVYGQFVVDGKNHYVHRLAYEWAVGSIAEGARIDHLCHVTLCVRLTHLRSTTQPQNMQNRRGANINSKSGIRGVYWMTRDARWCGCVMDQGVAHRAYFGTSDDAAVWVAAKRIELGLEFQTC